MVDADSPMSCSTALLLKNLAVIFLLHGARCASIQRHSPVQGASATPPGQCLIERKMVLERTREMARGDNTSRSATGRLTKTARRPGSSVAPSGPTTAKGSPLGSPDRKRPAGRFHFHNNFRSQHADSNRSPADYESAGRLHDFMSLCARFHGRLA